MSDDMLPDDFSLWFALKAATVEKDWGRVEELLSSSFPRAIPHHDLTRDAVANCVMEGKADIIRAFFVRGYVSESKDVASLVKTICSDGKGASGVGAALKEVGDSAGVDLNAFVKDALQSPWVEWTLGVFAEAGADILQDGATLRHIFNERSGGGFCALLDHGVSVFSPAVVAYMLSPDAEPQTADTRVLRDEWLESIAVDEDAKKILEKAERALSGTDDLRAGLFLNPHRHDASGAPVMLVGILAAKGQAGRIFAAPARWAAHPDEAAEVHAALAAYGEAAQAAAPLEPVLAAAASAQAAKRQAGLRQDHGFRLGRR